MTILYELILYNYVSLYSFFIITDIFKGNIADTLTSFVDSIGIANTFVTDVFVVESNEEKAMDAARFLYDICKVRNIEVTV